MHTFVRATSCCALIAFVGCGVQSPFQYADVAGKVSYEDGALLPVPELVINFHPQISSTKDGKFARVGSAVVDPTTGEFANAVSLKGRGGLVCGRHKVTLHLPGCQPLPPRIASADYGNPDRTPLEVDTREQRFDIRVKRPK